jgi:hypothetical protein
MPQSVDDKLALPAANPDPGDIDLVEANEV